MTRNFALIFLFLAASVQSQTLLDDFKIDLLNATQKTFEEEQLNHMFRTYSSLLTPQSGVTQLMADVKGEELSMYPLAEFKKEPLYSESMGQLFSSDNPKRRILSYLMVASSGDSSYESQLLERIKTETEEGNLLWAAVALLSIKTERTTAMFDYLVANERLGRSHIIPLYFQLNKDSIRATAYNRIKSEDAKTKILAAQSLGVTGLNPKTEALLKEAVKTWDIEIKGYAIYTIREMQIGELLADFKPLLDSTQTRSIALGALANSPTKEDRIYVQELASKQDTVSKELLRSLFESKHADNIEFWLEALQNKPIEADYYFQPRDQPLLLTDEILPKLHQAFDRIEESGILKNLVFALNGRSDDRSSEILLSLFRHTDSGVRFWASRSISLEVPELKDLVPELLANPALRTVGFVEIAIQIELDGLHDLFDEILKTNPNLDWKRSAVEYLSNFPLPRHKELFISLLADEAEDEFVRRTAAMGLGQLGDEDSVDFLIERARKESAISDYNVQTYLIALAMIKGEKAKAEIASYGESREPVIRELVAKILKDW